jgi:STE24 endopeptidase
MDIFLIVILVFLSLDFFTRLALTMLNRSHMKAKPKPEVQGIYNQDQYLKSQQYQRDNSKLQIISEALGFIILIGMLYFQVFAWFDKTAMEIFSNPILHGLVFFVLLGLASDLISLPFDIYKTFVIENQYGFNRTSAATFVLDKLKGWLLALFIGGLAILLLIGTWELLGFWFWLPAWALITLIILALSSYGSIYIARLFNKLSPLEAGELRKKINDYAEQVNFPVRDIFVMDGSRRSSKANAYFTGLGKIKRIVLYDTLIQKLSTDQVVAVLAHEAGHYKKGHINKLLFISIIQSGVMLFLLALALSVPELAASFGVDEPSFHIGLLAFVLLYTPISFIMGLFGNIVSRKFEFEADAFAAETGYAGALSDALKNLSTENLSNLSPHPAYVFFNYSHPDLASRLGKLAQESE